MRTSRRLKFSTMLLLIVLIAYVPLTLTVRSIIRANERRELLENARQTSERIVEMNFSIHKYFAKELKPAVFALVGGKLPEGYFDPRWMSSTHAVRSINAYRGKASWAGFSYKECAINARAPESEADAFERNFLERSAKDQRLTEWSGVREIDGKSYFAVLMRGESMEEDCLLCHSDPKRAPSGLVKRFGDKRSFGRKAGDLVSVISVRVPLATAYAAADAHARRVVLSISASVAVTLMLLFFIGRTYLTRPLERLSKHLKAISEDDSLLGSPIPTGGSHEIQEVAEAFAAMAGRVKEHVAELESKVTARTESLTVANQALRDEVERRQAEEKKALEVAKFSRLLFEEAGDGIVLLRPQPGGPPVIVDMNRKAARMNGLDDESEVIGKPVVVLDAPESADLAAGRAEQVLERGELLFEVRHRAKDGRTVPLEVHARRIDVGGIPHILSAERDITARLELEDRLRHAQKMEAMGTLAGGIAHDFTNILTPVMAYAELALMRLDEAHPVREDLTELLRAAGRAVDLVKQILAVGRREGDGVVAPMKLGGLVKETTKFLRASLPASIEIRTEVDPSCGAVMGDPSQLHQVLLNLCTNAGYAMAEAGGTLTVSVASAAGEGVGRSGRWVRLAIADTGVGIPPDVASRIFEPYFTTKPVGKGSGLGLSVVHGIVSTLGGEVTVRSQVGNGTTFEVWLPEVMPSVESEPPLPEEVPRGDGERVLVVDDEEGIRNVLKRVLASLGYTVTACEEGTEALAVFRADPGAFDVVLTDHTMPGMSGLDLADAMLRIRPGLRIVLGTGFTEGVDTQSTKEHGIGALLMKPYDGRTLGEALRRVLAGEPKVAPRV